MAQLQQGRLDLAEASFRNASRLDPTLAAAWNGIAHPRRGGDFDASCAASRTAISLDSRQAEAYLRLATDLKGRVSDDELDAMQRLLDDESLRNDDRALLGFAVAAVLERRGLFDPGGPALGARPRASFDGEGRARVDV